MKDKVMAVMQIASALLLLVCVGRKLLMGGDALLAVECFALGISITSFVMIGILKHFEDADDDITERDTGA